MTHKIITNNKKVKEYYKNRYEIIFLTGSYSAVLYDVRNRIHKGAVLITHPLSGSIKPGETPFKSILVSNRKGDVDCNSLALIEQAVNVYEKFSKQKQLKDEQYYTERVLEDFREIDFTLLFSALR